MKTSKIRTAAMIGTVLATLAGPVAQADDYTPPKVYTVTPTGVNLSDGSYTFTETDIAIGPLTLERFYISGLRDPNTKFFGPRVTSNFDIYVSRNKRPAITPGILPVRYAPIVHIGSAIAGVYAQAGTTSPVYGGNDDSNTAVLSNSGSIYTFTAHDGTIYTFGGPTVAGNADGQRVTSITFTDGRTQTFSYNGSGQLKMVTDSSGYALIFDYNGSGLISAACGFNLSQDYVTASSTCASAALKTSYTYTGGLLTSVTDVTGQVTSYGRTGNSEISCITPPGASVCKVATTFVSGQPYTVSSQTLADGTTWTYAASGDASASRTPDAIYIDDPTAYTAVTDPNSKTSYYRFSKASPYNAQDALGRVTSYVYTGGYEYEWSAYPEPPPARPEGTMMTEADLPEGNKYLAEYNGPYNSVSKETFVPKAGSGLSNVVLQYGYSCSSMGPSCTKPTWKKDAKGNQTDFTYTSYGAIQSEMQPAPTSGAARPLKLYTYVSKYAYVKNSGGTLVAAASPIYVPDTMTECETVAGSSTPTCDTSAPQLVTTYEYGANGTANNLLVHGMVVTDALTSVSRRTCYGYDGRGRKISTTTPRAGLTVCP